MFGVLALASVAAIGTVPLACSTGGVGDPCTPEDEYNASFNGFTVALENIESRSFQCATRICLVNHFQGRVSCPLGQAPPGTSRSCNPAKNGTDCPSGEACVLSETFAPSCSSCMGDTTGTCVATPCPDVGAMGVALNCTSLSTTQGCTAADNGNCSCTCTTSDSGMTEGVTYTCEPSSATDPTSPSVLHAYLCHTKGSCQTIADGQTMKNVGKDCCVPGTDNPVSVAVCGQCTSDSFRDANDAVYCSCRCCAPCCSDLTLDPVTAASQGCSTDLSICGAGNPNGNQCDPNFNYCDCPNGYTCAGIRPYVGLGDKQLAGSYCVKQGTAYTGNPASCANVIGYADQSAGCTGVSMQPTM